MILLSILAVAACIAQTPAMQTPPGAESQTVSMATVTSNVLAPGQNPMQSILNLPNLQFDGSFVIGDCVFDSFTYGDFAAMQPLVVKACTTNFSVQLMALAGGTWTAAQTSGCPTGTNQGGDSVTYWGPCQLGTTTGGCSGITNGSVYTYFGFPPSQGDRAAATATLYCSSGQKPITVTITLPAGCYGLTVRFYASCTDGTCYLYACTTYNWGT
jgi:hypothetical protein